MNPEHNNVTTMNPITAIRANGPFTSATVAVVVAALLSSALVPTVGFAAPAVRGGSSPTFMQHSHDKLLAQIAKRLDEIVRKTGSGESATRDIASIAVLQAQLSEMDQQTLRELKQEGAALMKGAAVPSSKERYSRVLNQFNKERESVHSALSALQTAAPPAAVSIARELRQRLHGYAKGQSHHPFDPKRLPFHMREAAVRRPKESAKELKDLFNPNLPMSSEQLLPAQRKVEVALQDDAATNVTTLEQYWAPSLLAAGQEVASIGSTAGLLAVSAVTPPGPEYLLPTEDAQITQAIRDLAAQLQNNPIKIYNWVRNNIDFLPTYGSIQGSDATLATKRGNAYDTASLLIALLRAAGVPARYVYGTVQMPAAQAMNWIGGMNDPDAAAIFMSQGGIPNYSVTNGGVVTGIRFEHAWVEAWVDFYPSRGSKNVQGDSWVPLDASFKQYVYTSGVNLRQSVPFDEQSFLSSVQASSETNTSEGWVKSIDEPVLQNALAGYQTRVQNYVIGQNPDATTKEVIGGREVLATSAPVFAASLPYRLIAVGNRYASLPSQLRHTLKFEFYSNAADKAYENPEFALERSVASLAGHRMSLVYVPATADDKKVLDDAFANHQTTFAAYTVDFRPVLKLENQVLATGAASVTGTQQYLRVVAQAPGYIRPQDYPVRSGDAFAFALNAAGVTPGQFQSRIEARDLSDGRDDSFLEEMFYQVALGYWAQEEALSQIIASADGVVAGYLPSHGMAGAPITVTYRYGVPNRAGYESRVLDVKEILLAVEAKNDDPQSRVAYARKRGHIGSYLEAGIYDQSFLMEAGNSISAVTGLRIANQRDIRIYRVTRENVSSVLPNLHVDDHVKADIVSATNAGLEVTVPQYDITVGSFSGAGYIVFDPQTGAGQYLISGGRNGDSSPGPVAVYPLPEMPAHGATGLMLGTVARQGAAFAVSGGTVSGFVVSSEAVAAGGAAGGGSAELGPIALLIAALVIASANAAAIEEKYPRISQIYRHYTNSVSAGAIWLSKMFIDFGSPKDFGPGIYFEAPPDLSITCANLLANSGAIAVKYNLAPPDAFVEIEVTRAGYWDAVIDEQINARGAVETIFRLPFLYFGPFSVGIDGYDVCP